MPATIMASGPTRSRSKARARWRRCRVHAEGAERRGRVGSWDGGIPAKPASFMHRCGRRGEGRGWAFGPRLLLRASPSSPRLRVKIFELEKDDEQKGECGAWGGLDHGRR